MICDCDCVSFRWNIFLSILNFSHFRYLHILFTWIYDILSTITIRHTHHKVSSTFYIVFWSIFCFRNGKWNNLIVFPSISIIIISFEVDGFSLFLFLSSNTWKLGLFSSPSSLFKQEFSIFCSKHRRNHSVKDFSIVITYQTVNNNNDNIREYVIGFWMTTFCLTLKCWRRKLHSKPDLNFNLHFNLRCRGVFCFW